MIKEINSCVGIKNKSDLRDQLNLFEIEINNLENINSSNIYQYVYKHGYKLIAFAIGNAYFLKSHIR